MGGQLYITISDAKEIQECHKTCRGRPKLAKVLLPFLGEANLLFQDTAGDHGAFVKQLRLRYGKMVNGPVAGRAVHAEVLRFFDRKVTSDWGSGQAVDVFDELRTILYDVMGMAVFGGVWMADDNGREIFRLHRYLIEWSMQMGVKALKKPRSVAAHPSCPPSLPPLLAPPLQNRARF